MVKLLENCICLDMIFSELGGYSSIKTLRTALRNKGFEIIKFGKKEYINKSDFLSIFSISTITQKENQIAIPINISNEAKKVNTVSCEIQKTTFNQNIQIEKIRNKYNRNVS